MHYIIYGTGAVGGLIGGRLALSGQRVTFLARPHLAEALRSNGLTLQACGNRTLLEHPETITALRAAFSDRPADLIVLTVKAYDCRSAAQDIQTATTTRIPVLSMLNGVGNEQTLAELLGEDRVLSGTLTTAVQHLEPGLIRVERERGVGLVQDRAIVPSVAAGLRRAGFDVRLYQNRARMKWSKLLTNIVANVSSAILGWPPERIFAHPGLARLEIEALRETVRVMRGLGFSPQNLPGVPVALLGRAIFLPAGIIRPMMGRVVAKGRGEKLPSFHYDIGKGRSEVEWLNGAVVRRGSEQGIATPANRILTDTMLELTHRQVDPKILRNDPERLLRRARENGVPGL